MINYTLLRTAGRLASNYTGYEQKLAQLEERAANQSNGFQALKSDAEQIAISHYGPRDPIWEAKYRKGGLRLRDELLALESIQNWSHANACRFMELAFFTTEQCQDTEGMAHVCRLDFSNLERIGNEAWSSAMNLVVSCATESKRQQSLDDAKPRYACWLERETEGGYLFRIAEVEIASEMRSTSAKRLFCELHVP